MAHFWVVIQGPKLLPSCVTASSSRAHSSSICSCIHSWEPVMWGLVYFQKRGLEIYRLALCPGGRNAFCWTVQNLCHIESFTSLIPTLRWPHLHENYIFLFIAANAAAAGGDRICGSLALFPVRRLQLWQRGGLEFWVFPSDSRDLACKGLHSGHAMLVRAKLSSETLNFISVCVCIARIANSIPIRSRQVISMSEEGGVEATM